ncbi:MAG TPA: carboxypeptidase-like regulatory domain-containing protein [Bryobacteraceae bacterium]|nr:carboxypeptidase-like regulatory domain-containing protein [Bryobacteraceae bacterium]
MKRVSISLILFACLANAQGTDAVVTGNVLDATGAAIAAAVITAVNVNTGVQTQVTSNASGVYLFAALPPGDYRLTAEKEGFKELVRNQTTLRLGDHLEQNLVLEVGATKESVQVTANSDSVNYLTSSQGGLLNSQRIQDLPVSGRNAMELVGTQAGMVTTSSGANMNGARTDMMNITLDGTNIQDNAVLESITGQMISTTVDRVEEVRVVTSPADAEFGRGSGQVQLVSRSGTNKFHGSAYDFAHNTDLNANTWANNRSGVARSVQVLNQVGGRMDGPIRKNKTFFFALFEASINHTQTPVTDTVLTSQARQGVFRFYPGVQNGNANANNPSVDLNGNPVSPRGATGPLQTVSLFGLDPNRLAPDSTGIIAKNLALIPLPNNYLAAGDGLNTAAYIWQRPATDDLYSLDLRVDHNFSQSERLTASYNHDFENYPNGNDGQQYPSSVPGEYLNHSVVASLALVSTLSASMVNEARIGVQRAHLQFEAPWTSSSEGTNLLPSIGGVPYIISLNGPTSPYGTSSSEDPQGRITPVYQAGDKITWLRGRHALKAGIDLRFVDEDSFHAFDVIPRVTLGTGNVGTQGITTIPGIGANSTLASNLLTTLAGSVGSTLQMFYSPGGTNPQYLPFGQEQHTWDSREWDTFFQDDIKLRNDLTINLGVRWEYYGVPYEAHGRMVDLVGGSQSIFGVSGTTFASEFNPGYMPGSLMQLQLIGKNSPNPNQQAWQPDYRDFAPAVGLSWALPWLGQNKTVFRAGYFVSYEKNFLALLNQIYGYGAPGLGSSQSITPSTYQNLGQISLPLPVPSTPPMATIPINDNNSSTQSIDVADSGWKRGYVQNWNASLGRQIGKGVVLDVRYVASKGTKLTQGTNVNEVNIFENGILNAFNTTDAGGNAALLNQIFNGLNIPGVGVVNGTTLTGSQAMRQSTTLQSYLLNNNVGGFANFLASNTFVTGIRGGLLLNGHLPANFVVVNPQLGTADLVGNYGNSTYNSLQTEVNKHFQGGFQIQGSYVRSKTLGSYDGNTQNEVSNFLTLRNEHLSKQLLSYDIPNLWRTSGIWDLPFGPGRSLLGSSHGVVSHLVEKWQTAVIFNKQSGTPTSFSNSAGDTFNGNASTDMQWGPLPSGSVQKVGNNVVYFNGLTQIPDPSIKNIPSSLQSLSTLYAIQGANGQLLMSNPVPGLLGSMNQAAYRGLGSFTLNMQLSKAVTINRERNITLRVRADAINLLNRPIWGTPNLNIDSTSFGQITTATGNRSVVLGARLEF